MQLNRKLTTALVLFSSCIGAQTTLYVSSRASESGVCSRTEPCRQISQALQTVPGGGSIVILDSAAYEPFVISKAVSIIASEGVTPVVKATQTSSAIEIRASNETVVLIRGMVVEGERSAQSAGPAISAIRHFGGKLTLLDSIVRNAAGAGITASPGTRLFLSGSTFDDLGGLQLSGASTIISNCRFLNLSGSINVAGGSAIIKSTFILGQGTDRSDGVIVAAQDNRSAEALLEDVTITNTKIALQTSTPATATGLQAVVRVTRSTIAANEEGVSARLGGSILSAGNSLVRGNTTNGTFSGNIPLE